MTRFFVVRHGHTKGTEKHRYYGKTDMPLSKLGISQINELKKIFRKIPINYIYTSPLKRCTESVSILRQKKYTPIEISQDIIEIDFGDWEGLTLRQMEKRNPRKFNNWLYDFQNFWMPNGESVKNMIRRVNKFWKYVTNRHNKGNILIITHGGPAKVIIMKALGLQMKKFWNLNISTGSINIIESYNGEALVKAINFTPLEIK